MNFCLIYERPSLHLGRSSEKLLVRLSLKSSHGCDWFFRMIGGEHAANQRKEEPDNTTFQSPRIPGKLRYKGLEAISKAWIQWTGCVHPINSARNPGWVLEALRRSLNSKDCLGVLVWKLWKYGSCKWNQAEQVG